METVGNTGSSGTSSASAGVAKRARKWAFRRNVALGGFVELDFLGWLWSLKLTRNPSFTGFRTVQISGSEQLVLAFCEPGPNPPSWQPPLPSLPFFKTLPCTSNIPEQRILLHIKALLLRLPGVPCLRASSLNILKP